MFLCKFLACLLLLLALNCRTTIQQYLDKDCIKEICTAHLRRDVFPNYQELEIYDKDVQAVSDLSLQIPLAESSGTCPTDLINPIIRCNCNNTICWVTYIDFSNKVLTGQIPDNIGDLTNLTRLNLRGNRLSKWIPQSFKNLTSLSFLDLCNNNLEGPIPQFFGGMKSLEVLSLCGNQFTGSIPHELGTLPSLEYFDLCNNNLEGPIPQFFGGMKSLEELYLCRNQFSGSIPHELGTLPSLEYLDLQDNLLSGKLPDQLGGLSNLIGMYLMNNDLSGELPPSIGDLKSLRILDIRGNNFNGKIPNSIANLKNLQKLSLMGNNFEGPLPSLSSLLNLSFFAITDFFGGRNGFPFPDFGNMEILRVLILRNCTLIGKIPPFIWELRNLLHLDLSFNNLTGGIPSKLNATSGKKIFLRRNKLSGELPGWLMNLSKSFVDVSENNFTRPTLPIRKISPDTNLFECCSNISSNEYRDMKWLEADYLCADNRTKYDHLYINCGGNTATINQRYYQADVNSGGGSNFFLSGDKSWAFSSMGTFLSTNSQQFITLSKTWNIFKVYSPLYMEARVAAVSLKYYGFCLKNGKYTLRLHFAEIGWDATEKFRIKKKRVFDVDIQGGQHYLRNFNIEEEAGGVYKEIRKDFDISVKHNRMEIHLYWSGKGSTYDPTKYYGPLISAISLSPRGFPFYGVELYPGGVFNFHHIVAATNNFDTKNKIGEGGAVYKGVLPDGVEIAVKIQSKQRARTIINEIGTIYALQHPNIAKPMACYSEGKQVLLVYKYMENISLQHALFGLEVDKSRLNWPTRVKICLGMAKGLAFLHEGSGLEGSGLDVIHSNIKPSNILLDKDYNVKISDFGYAQLHDAQLHYQDTTSGNMPKGERKAHMAPEYMQGLPITPKADVYSFGMVTLEIVRGQNIHSYGNHNETIHLLNLAYQYQEQQNLIALVDPSLGSNYKRNEALNILDLAMRCVSSNIYLRPKMSDAVKVLEGKTKLKTSSNIVPHLVPEFKMAEPLALISESTQSGRTSLEGSSNTTTPHSASKGIDDDSVISND